MNSASFNNSGEQVNNTVQDTYCQALAQIYSKYVQLKRQIIQNKNKLKSVLSALLHPARAIAGAAAAELTSAIGTAASSIVSQLLTTASGSVRAALEMIFRQLLGILTAGANEIFGIIALPLEKARKYAYKERELLVKSEYNLSIMLRIISKWLSGANGELFYRKMKEALIYIERAVSEMSIMISELEFGTGTASGSYFNKARYSIIVGYLQQAISITEQDTFIVQALGLTNALESERQAMYNERMTKIDQEYKRRRQKIDEQYRDSIINIQKEADKKIADLSREHSTITDRAILAAKRAYETNMMESKMSIAEAKWRLEIDRLEAQYEVDKSRASMTALDKSYYKRVGARIGQNAEELAFEFSRDYQLMIKNLSEMVENITSAFLAYKQSQLFTGFAYSAIDRIKNLIKWLSEISGYAGEATGTGVAQVFRASKALAEDVQTRFETATPPSGGTLDSASLAATMKWGNIKLRVSHSLISGVVTKSLVDMINFDDVLASERDRFMVFRESVEKIPDWDGKLGVWGTNTASPIVSPYVALISRLAAVMAVLRGGTAAASMGAEKLHVNTEGVAAKAAAISGQAVGMSWFNTSMRNDIRATRSDIRKLLNHNNLVCSVLSSYTPYSSDRVSAFQNLLDAVGLNYLQYAILAIDAVALLESVKDLTIAGFSRKCFDTPQKREKYLSSLPYEQRKMLESEIEMNQYEAYNALNVAASLDRMEQCNDWKDRNAELAMLDISDYITNKGVKDGGPGFPTNNEIQNAEALYKL